MKLICTDCKEEYENFNPHRNNKTRLRCDYCSRKYFNKRQKEIRKMKESK